VLPRGIFISGKFDLRLNGIPYSTLAQAFQGLIRQILSGGDEDIGRWRDAIREAVGNHASLLTDLIPQLARLIGPQAPVAALSPAEARLRFQLVFQRFVSVFARPEHPLVVFVDDLHWLDTATLTLIQYLITHRDTRHVLLIGAYRDNEVGPEHPLALALDTVRQTDTPISELRLGPLSTEDVNRLLCDALRCEPADVRPLALLVHRKTGGNAFFAVQFLTSLAEDHLLRFDQHKRSWTWDLDGIGSKGSTDNLLGLMIGRLRRLPDATQEALKLLARLDPNYAAAHAFLAWCHEICFMREGFDEADKTAGLRHARTAIESGTDDATTLAVAALVIGALSKDYKAALNAIERALSLNPSSAPAHYWGALLHASSGNLAAATTHANRALRLSRFDPVAFAAHGALGHVAFHEARYDEAASHYARAVQANPRFRLYYFLQAAALALARRAEEARPIVAPPVARRQV
jgi:tetratricopeptide (TPR) repeat protein